MPILATCFLASALVFNGNVGSEIETSRPLIPCPDLNVIRQKYRDGRVDELYAELREFFSVLRQSDGDLEKDCKAQVYKFMGILSLMLGKNRSETTLNWAWLAVNFPREEIFDLELPLEPQILFDEIKSKYSKRRNWGEAWEDQWLPPVKPMLKPTQKELEVRKAYHAARLNFALAKNRSDFQKVFRFTSTSQDPAFQLLEASLLLRLGIYGEPLTDALAKFKIGSIIVTDFEMVNWRSRLGEELRFYKKNTGKEPSEPNKEISEESLPAKDHKIINESGRGNRR